MNRLLSIKFVVAVIIGISLGYLFSRIIIHRAKINTLVTGVKYYRNVNLGNIIVPTPSSQPINDLTDFENDSEFSEPPTPSQARYFPPPANPQDQLDWGIAKEIDEGTYTILVGNDEVMGTPEEIRQALNQYRSVNGRGSLEWDDKLGNYSQIRADLFKSIETTDKHAGFNDYLENQDGFQQLGFTRVGENSYFGGPLTGTHLIEWVFAKSPGHNANQLESAWSHVGIGVTDRSANLIFATERF